MPFPSDYTWQNFVVDLIALVVLLLLLYLLWRWLHKRRQSKTAGVSETPQADRVFTDYHNETSNSTSTTPRSNVEDELQRKTDGVKEILEAEPLLLKAMTSRAGMAHINFKDTTVTQELARRIAQRLDKQTLQMFRVGAQQQDLPFKPKRTTETNAVPYVTETTSPALMTGPEQLHQVLPDQLLQPDDQFYAQYLQGNLHVLQSYEEVTHEAILHVLLDGSRSMEERMRGGIPRHVWARGVAVNLLLRAVRGEASFMFRVFDSEPHKLMRATSPDEAVALIDFILSSGYTGGGTNIRAAVTQGVEDIKGGGVFQHADILVISDGDDPSMDNTAEVTKLLGDIRLNVAIIGRESNALKRVSTTYRTF